MTAAGLACFWAATPALAAESTLLSRANTLWDSGEYAQAEKLYTASIAAGGLQPDELVQAWARDGACLAYLGKKQAATEAFRNAAVLNPNFLVPDDVGPKAAAAALPARAQAAALGDFTLRAEVPKSVTANETWGWTVQLDAAHASLVAKVSARWGAEGSTSTQGTETAEKAGAERLSFLSTKPIPANAKRVELRLAALDKRGNTMKLLLVILPVTADSGAKPAAAEAGAPPGTSGTTAPAKGGGFWHTAWPWIIGGTVLAAGGGAAYYYGTRPAPNVDVLAPTVTLTP